MADYRTDSPIRLKAHARVLGHVSPNYLRIIIAPGVGLADGGIHNDLPLELVPPDLRIPNAEFFVYLDVVRHEFVEIERVIDEPDRSSTSDQSLPTVSKVQRFNWLLYFLGLFK